MRGQHSARTPRTVRRRIAAGGALLLATLAPMTAAQAREQQVWQFDRMDRVGGREAAPHGGPTAFCSAIGPAVAFDGVDDSVLVQGHPLAGKSAFSIEVAFRPMGGAFEQRFLHVAQTDPATGQDVTMSGTRDLNGRMMFEIRVVGDQWYLDGFLKSEAGSLGLLPSTRLHPLGQWYSVAQTYDGKTYRIYVDGVLQAEGDVAFKPHGAGRVRVGARMNLIDNFKGDIAQVRFTDEALGPSALMTFRDVTATGRRAGRACEGKARR